MVVPSFLKEQKAIITQIKEIYNFISEVDIITKESE
jgi:hypothetical protein